jgi:hypothetical protein
MNCCIKWVYVVKETEFHTAVLDRRGAAGVLCILEDIIEMELKM